MATEMTRKVGAAILLAELEWTPKSPLSKEETMARAAIEAMRPTTKAMRLAMCPMNGADYVVGDPGDVWSAAIDAALE